MPSRERVQALVNTVEQGKILDAVHEFYADDVTMQDNQNPPTVVKAANLIREEGFGGVIAEVHENRAELLLVDGDRAVIHWIFDFTDKESKHFRFDQIAMQTWRGDHIAAERFYYDSATLIL